MRRLYVGLVVGALALSGCQVSARPAASTTPAPSPSPSPTISTDELLAREVIALRERVAKLEQCQEDILLALLMLEKSGNPVDVSVPFCA
jgi:hypothetical protein